MLGYNPHLKLLPLVELFHLTGPIRSWRTGESKPEAACRPAILGRCSPCVFPYVLLPQSRAMQARDRTDWSCPAFSLLSWDRSSLPLSVPRCQLPSFLTVVSTTTALLTLSCPELLNWGHRVPSSAMENSESRHSRGFRGSDYTPSTSLKKKQSV